MVCGTSTRPECSWLAHSALLLALGMKPLLLMPTRVHGPAACAAAWPVADGR